MGIKEEITTYPLYKKLILVAGGGLLVSLPIFSAWAVLQTTQLQSEARRSFSVSSPISVPGSMPCDSPICQSSCETDKDCPGGQQCMSTTCRFCAAPLPVSVAPVPPTSGPVSTAPIPTPTSINMCSDRCRTNADCKWGEKCMYGYYKSCNKYIKFCVTPSPVTAAPIPTSTPGRTTPVPPR